MILPAISLWQPWASALFTGAKRNETRSWPMPQRYVGKPVLIHAAKHLEKDFIFDCDYLQCAGVPYEKAAEGRYGVLPFGALIGVVVFGASRRTESFSREELETSNDWPLFEEDLGNFGPGRWAWPVLRYGKLTTSLPYRGAQGFFAADVPEMDVPAWLRDGVLL